jgi:hypothetical protein
VAGEPALGCVGDVPALADLEGDGSVEVIVGSAVIEGASGVMRVEGTAGKGRYAAFRQIGAISFAADLDQDGIQEVIAGNTVYNAAGSIVCQTGEDDGFPAVADLDGDGRGEIVTVGNGSVRIVDASCGLVAEWALPDASNGGPPTIADFDGDMVPEIGVASASRYAVYEADGTQRWAAATSDAISFSSGAAVFDFDGDGRAEVVYADERALWVFDGTTGAVRLQDDRHSSRTLHEYPVVADVDDDGLAEIVIPNGGGHYSDDAEGLYVLRSADGTWQGARPVWNQHAYNIVNIDDDLTLPAPVEPNWPIYNSFRSGDMNPVSGDAWADARPIIDVCTEGCDLYGQVVVGVKVANAGTAALRAELPVALYVGGAGVPVQMRRTSSVVEPGAASDVIPFVVSREQAERGMRVVVDDLGAGVGTTRECHEDNNEGYPVGVCF